MAVAVPSTTRAHRRRQQRHATLRSIFVLHVSIFVLHVSTVASAGASLLTWVPPTSDPRPAPPTGSTPCRQGLREQRALAQEHRAQGVVGRDQSGARIAHGAGIELRRGYAAGGAGWERELRNASKSKPIGTCMGLGSCYLAAGQAAPARVRRVPLSSNTRA